MTTLEELKKEVTDKFTGWINNRQPIAYLLQEITSLIDRAYQAGQEDTELAELRMHDHGVECKQCFEMKRNERRAGLLRAAEMTLKEMEQYKGAANIYVAMDILAKSFEKEAHDL